MVNIQSELVYQVRQTSDLIMIKVQNCHVNCFKNKNILTFQWYRDGVQNVYKYIYIAYDIQLKLTKTNIENLIVSYQDSYNKLNLNKLYMNNVIINFYNYKLKDSGVLSFSIQFDNDISKVITIKLK